VGALSTALVVAVAPSVHAQGTYPAKPVTFVIPAPPGGLTDQLGRIIGDRLSERLGQRVLIDNRGGAGGNLAAEFVARAAPDGHTILMGTQGTHATNQYLYKSLRFDPVKDFIPVHTLLSISNGLVANADRPFHSLKELVDYAKQKPGKLSVAIAGYGTSSHLMSELFQTAAGVKFLHVLYKGSTPAMVDLLGGQIDLSLDFPASTLPHIRAGKLRALAVTGPAREPTLPDVPTMVEAGYPQAQAVAWIGMFFPAGTPAPIVDRMQAEVAATLQEPAVIASIRQLGGAPFDLGGEAFAAFIQSEQGKWKAIIERSGARIE
jgi:tripartite-type tricarboxylate transporter receptor subunit TctC